MSFSDVVNSQKFSLLAEVDPPKGADLSGFLDAALRIKGRVAAVTVTDCSHAIMRMTPAAPCRALIERNIEPLMVVNGRDRNRLSFQGDLLSAWALGVRNILVAEGQDPAVGDQPMVKTSGDLNLNVMLKCVSALRAGEDLGGEPLDGQYDFFIGAGLDVSNDIAVNRRTAEEIPRLAEHGVRFVVLGPTYDVNILDLFARAAQTARVKLLASIMLLKSVAMIRYLNDLPGAPPIPHEYLKQMMKAEAKTRAGMDIAANLIRDVRDRCQGAVLIALGWGSQLPQFLDLLEP